MLGWCRTTERIVNMLIVSPSAGLSRRTEREESAGILGKKMGILQNDKPNAELAMRDVARHLKEEVGVDCVDDDRFIAAEPVSEAVVSRLARTCDWVLVGSCD
jgi:hypothetical protein